MSTLESTATGTLPAGTWQLDPVHSQVGFAVKYMVGTFRGSFSPVGSRYGTERPAQLWATARYLTPASASASTVPATQPGTSVWYATGSFSPYRVEISHA